MTHFLLRLVACLALAVGSISLGGCVLLPGGGWYGGVEHYDYIRHDQ